MTHDELIIALEQWAAWKRKPAISLGYQSSTMEYRIRQMGGSPIRAQGLVLDDSPEIVEQLEAAVNALDRHHKRVIELKWVSGLSNEEIAKRARIGGDTPDARRAAVRRRLNEAYERLEKN